MNATSSPTRAGLEAATPSRRTSIIFAVLDLCTAVAVLGLARILWSSTSLWHVLLGVWAALLVASALGLLSGKRIGRVLARVAAFYQLGFLAVAIASILSSVAYLWGIYGQIGVGVSVALLVVLALLFEVVGLLPVFKLRALGFAERRTTNAATSVGAVVVVGLLATAFHCTSVYASSSLVPWKPIPAEASAAMSEYLAAVVSKAPAPALPEALGRPEDRWVLRVFLRGRVHARHEVNGDLHAATKSLAAELERRNLPARSDYALAIDRVVAENDIAPLESLRGALSIVPGLDGVSADVEGTRVTVVPHELVIRQMLSKHVPVPFIPEFEIGADPEAVRKLVCKTAHRSRDCVVQSLRRARTEAWVHEKGETHGLYRSRPVAERQISPTDARAGAMLAGSYVLRSIRPDGRFQYTLSPITGRGSMKPYNVPRHAGTSWFLLELYEATGSQEFLRVAEQALDWLEGELDTCGPGLRCIGDGEQVDLGPQALSLVAFATHARLAGVERYGQTARDLATVVMRMQREDGDFDFGFNRTAGESVPVGRHLYAAGQAALGLAISGQVLDDQAHLQAARRALDFMAGPYWDFPLSNLFFIEEHWTCLAADELHRLFGDPAHAHLCLASAKFDRQLQHDDESVFPDYVGGIGFTPFFPPYTTTTAGRGEGLIAAYRISERLGAPDHDLLRGIDDAVRFLVHNQYKGADGYAFRKPFAAIGGVPWNYYDPTIRIDTVQHAGSVMLHGSEILEKAKSN